MKLEGLLNTIVKSTVTCSDCGKQFVGGHVNNERLACKDALSKLRKHQERYCKIK